MSAPHRFVLSCLGLACLTAGMCHSLAQSGTVNDRRRPVLALRGVGKTYPNGRVALRDVDLTLEEGEFVPPDSLDVQIMSQKYDQVLDQRSDVLSGEMQVVARANTRSVKTKAWATWGRK